MMINKRQKQDELVDIDHPLELSPSAPEIKELGWDDVMPVDIVGLEVGYRLDSVGGQKPGRAVDDPD